MTQKYITFPCIRGPIASGKTSLIYLYLGIKSVIPIHLVEARFYKNR